MINRKIMDELKKIKPRTTIYKLIKKIRKESGYKLTNKDAASTLAGALGIDIGKHLSPEELERLRNTPTEIKVIETKSKQTPQKVELKIKGIATNIPFLEKKTSQDLKKMSETYQLFYALENSIRSFILYTLQSKYPSEDWWNKKVPRKVKDDVLGRMRKEKANRWHAKRGGHPIHYANFGDYKNIIRECWQDFGGFFPDQHWIMSRLQDLEISRNIIAHTNPLPQNEINRIKLYFQDWISQVRR